MRVSEIRVNQIRVNQGLGVHRYEKRDELIKLWCLTLFLQAMVGISPYVSVT